MAEKSPADAYEYMQKAIKEYGGYTEAYSMLGKWYYDAGRYKDAAEVFSKASSSCKNGQKDFAKPLVKSLLNSYNPTAALPVINTYGSNAGDWPQLRAQATFMQQAMAQPSVNAVSHLNGRINSPESEMFPWISADTQVLYFTRRVKGTDEDFYRALIDTCGGWLYARNMGTPANTLAQEAAQMISADNHYLFFMRCDNRSETGWDRGGCDLYMAYTGDSTWSIPQSFGATINTPDYEGMPCLSADNRQLYFVSDRPGGYGGFDIWMSEFKSGLWQLPVNLGPNINTPGNETAPFLHLDNNTLYFSSDGHQGMGGADLFYCRRTGDTTWTTPQNMGYPVNSPADEASICITVDGKKAYFASDRDSIAGKFDIYETYLSEALRPIPVVTLKGFAYDSLSNERLNYTSVYINDAATYKQLYHFTSNRGDGSYMITLPAGRSFTFSADRVGYSETTGAINLPDTLAGHTIDYNIHLLPAGYQRPIKDSLVLTINFVKNSLKLTDENKRLVSEAIDPWLLEKGIVVMINGYTDISGTPLINEQFSYMRAQLVADEITAMGIDPSAISVKGWGDADPVMPNDTEEHMDMNRRVEVIIRR